MLAPWAGRPATALALLIQPHCHPDLGDQRLGRVAVDSGNALQVLDVHGIQLHHSRNALTQPGDGGLQILEMRGKLAQQGGIMVREASGERLSHARSPATRAPRIARPDASRMSMATSPSLRLADSNSFWTRFASRVRSWISVFQ